MSYTITPEKKTSTQHTHTHTKIKHALTQVPNAPSRAPLRNNFHPRPNSSRIQLDVRPLPHRPHPLLHLHTPPSPEHIHPVALSPPIDSHISLRAPHNRRQRHRDGNVHNYEICHNVRYTVEYTSYAWDGDVCFYVDWFWGVYICLGDSDGYVLLLCVEEGCYEGEEEGE